MSGHRLTHCCWAKVCCSPVNILDTPYGESSPHSEISTFLPLESTEIHRKLSLPRGPVGGGSMEPTKIH